MTMQFSSSVKKLFCRFIDAASALMGTDVAKICLDHVLTASIYLLMFLITCFTAIFTFKATPVLVKLILIQPPAIEELKRLFLFLKKRYKPFFPRFFISRLTEYRQIVSDRNHLKYLVHIKHVAHLTHIEYEIVGNAKLMITADYLVRGKFENVRHYIPLPPGGNFKKETIETFFDEKSCIFTIELKNFECPSFFSVDSAEEEEAIRLPIPNGKPEAKKEVKETKKEEKSVAANKKDAKQGAANDKDISEEEEKEETPKKPQSGEKRQNESAIKAPTTDKKAEMTTPHKTDGKKATPQPSKEPDKSSQKSNGTHSCKTCKRNFKTDGGLQAHIQAKHTSK